MNGNNAKDCFLPFGTVYIPFTAIYNTFNRKRDRIIISTFA